MTTAPPDGGGGGLPIQHKRVTYPAVKVRGMTGTDMSMVNTGAANVAKPCTDCYITGFQAGLADASGRQVNVREGYWLHHMVLGGGPALGTCGGNMPGVGFFSSGNERTPIDLTKSWNYGYPVRATDRWTLIEDLANISKTDETMSVTVDFDYVPMSTPGMRPATPLWFGAGNCVGVFANQGSRAYAAPAWKPTMAAKLIYVHMHMHDGAVDGTFAKNGQIFCDSTQTYGGKPEFIEGPDTMMPGMAHISSVHQCQGTAANPVVQFSPGDQLVATANYDANQHMMMDMGAEPIMGIGHAWVDTGN